MNRRPPEARRGATEQGPRRTRPRPRTRQVAVPPRQPAPRRRPPPPGWPARRRLGRRAARGDQDWCRARVPRARRALLFATVIDVTARDGAVTEAHRSVEDGVPEGAR